jgi:hypothetical protein
MLNVQCAKTALKDAQMAVLEQYFSERLFLKAVDVNNTSLPLAVLRKCSSIYRLK